MKDKTCFYEAPEVQVVVLKMEGGILQSSLDANREDYGEAIPIVW